jgi:L-iditol 2-dehydrogenase
VNDTIANVAAVLYAPRDVRVEPRPVPEPNENEVLIELHCVGVCGSDIHYYEHGRIGPHVVEQPLVLGHEAMGVVVGGGAGAHRHRRGARVALEPGVPCGRCTECRRGHYNVCAKVRFLATPPIDGAFTRYLALHEDYAFALPDGLSDEAGALIEPLSVAVWACAKAEIGPGSRVLITGAGPIGNLVAQVAHASGAVDIAVLDVNLARLERARRAGATRVIDTTRAPLPSDDASFDALIECTGHAKVTSAGIAALRPAGRAVLVGMGPDEEAFLPVALIQGRELVLTGTFRYANTYPAAIELAATGRVDLDGMIDARFPLAEADQALAANSANPELLKVMVSVTGNRGAPPA